MSDFTIVFIHGYTASHLADWYPNISKELDAFGINYIVPDLPGGEHPHAKDWLEVLHNEIIKINNPLVFVGHSLGSRTVLLYLEKYRPKVENVFLIAAFANRIENAERKDGDAYPDFFEHVINLEKIKPLVDKFIVMHSEDDSSIPFWQGEEIAKDLHAELIIYKNRDHFDKPENAPFILEQLRKGLQF